MKKELDKKLKKLLVVALIVLGVCVASDIVATVATYPTENHKQVARQLNEYNAKMMSYEELEEADTVRYDTLIATSEAQYTMAAAAVTGLASFAVYVYIVFFSYNRIRKQRIASNARGATVLTVVAASMVAMIPYVIFEYLYTGFSSFGPSLGFQALTVLFGFVVLAVITILITMVAESRYNKKHSFIVE